MLYIYASRPFKEAHITRYEPRSNVIYRLTSF